MLTAAGCMRWLGSPIATSSTACTLALCNEALEFSTRPQRQARLAYDELRHTKAVGHGPLTRIERVRQGWGRRGLRRPVAVRSRPPDEFWMLTLDGPKQLEIEPTKDGANCADGRTKRRRIVDSLLKLRQCLRHL
ncbi:MAG: hypothetical protein R2712_05875 [Vicinamibacterales bacterium]